MTKKLFDRALLAQRRRRASAHLVTYLRDQAESGLMSRLLDVTRSFPLALDLSPFPFAVTHARIGKCWRLQPYDGGLLNDPAVADLIADDEFLPFGQGRLDLILSNLSLHWVNDLPGCFTQIRYALKPNGLFLASTLGGETLTELRQVFAEAESEIMGGISPRIVPMLGHRDVAGLLQRAGFALPVAEIETVTVTYSDFWKMLRELRAMGESNVMVERLRHPTPKAFFQLAEQIYRERFHDDKGNMVMTFQILYLIGWAAHESQQQPAKRGSGQVGLDEFFNKLDKT